LVGSHVRGAGHYSASDPVGQVVSALAVVVSSQFTRSLAGLWRDIEAPLFPYQIFTSDTDGIEWLKKFLE